MLSLKLFESDSADGKVENYRDCQSVRVSYHLIKTYFRYPRKKPLYVKNSKVKMFYVK